MLVFTNTNVTECMNLRKENLVAVAICHVAAAMVTNGTALWNNAYRAIAAAAARVISVNKVIRSQ